LQREEEEQKRQEEETLRASIEEEEEEERNRQEEAEAKAKARAAEWEQEFYNTAGRAPPTQEETERKDSLIATALDIGIPENFLSNCNFPHEVEELINFRKQFDDIDVDRSGKLDEYEMKLAFSKLGLTLDDSQLKALLNSTDSTGDGEVDFEEFVLLIRSFQSSEQERTHQGTDRSSLLGLADAARNMEVTLEETEFGSKVVMKRREVKEWENYMQYPDPLHWAAGKGDLHAVQQFIRASDGAPAIPADWINKDGKMPLHYAALWNQAHVLRFLLQPPPHGAGVGVDPADAGNSTPLLLAVAEGHAEACELLLAHWANPCQRNAAGATGLHLACARGHPRVLALLLAAGAAVTASDDETVRVWSARDPALARTLESDRRPLGKLTALGAPSCMHVTQDRVATGHQDGAVRVSAVSTQQAPPYALRGQEGTAVLEGHSGTVLCARMQGSGTTAPGRHMVTGSEDATARLWDVPAARCVRVYRDGRQAQHASAVVAADLSLAGDRVVGGTRAGIVLVWRLSDAELVAALPAHTGTSVAVARLRGAELLTAAGDRTLRLWDLTGPRARVFGGPAAGGRGHTGAVRCAERVGPDRSFEFPLPDTIVSGSHTGELFLW
jgi:hypothetical protein